MRTITDQITTLLESARQARENGQPLIKVGLDAHLASLVIVDQWDEQAQSLGFAGCGGHPARLRAGRG